MILIVEPAAIGGRVVPRQDDRGAIGARAHVRRLRVVPSEPPVLRQGYFTIGDCKHAIDRPLGRSIGIAVSRVDHDHDVSLVGEPSTCAGCALAGQGTVDLVNRSGLVEGDEEAPRHAVDTRIGLAAVHVEEPCNKALPAHGFGDLRCQVAQGQEQSPSGSPVGLGTESSHERAGFGVELGQGVDRFGLSAGIAGGAERPPNRFRRPQSEQGGRDACAASGSHVSGARLVAVCRFIVWCGGRGGA